MYSDLEITLLMEQCSVQDTMNHMYKVLLHVELSDRSNQCGEITFIQSKSAGAMFFYDSGIEPFMSSLDDKQRKQIHRKIQKVVTLEMSSDVFIPLQQVICDKCLKPVALNEACLLFRTDYKDYNFEKPVACNFEIVHLDNCTHNDDDEFFETRLLSHITGSDGLANLLGIIDDVLEEFPATDASEIGEIVKRTQLPYYEVARFHKDLIHKHAEREKWNHAKYNRSVLRSVLKDSKQVNSML